MPRVVRFRKYNTNPSDPTTLVAKGVGPALGLSGSQGAGSALQVNGMVNFHAPVGPVTGSTLLVDNSEPGGTAVGVFAKGGADPQGPRSWGQIDY